MKHILPVHIFMIIHKIFIGKHDDRDIRQYRDIRQENE